MTLAPMSAYATLKREALATVILSSSLGRSCVAVFIGIFPSARSSAAAHIVNVPSGRDHTHSVPAAGSSVVLNQSVASRTCCSPITCVIRAEHHLSFRALVAGAKKGKKKWEGSVTSRRVCTLCYDVSCMGRTLSIRTRRVLPIPLERVLSKAAVHERDRRVGEFV